MFLSRSDILQRINEQSNPNITLLKKKHFHDYQHTTALLVKMLKISTAS